MTGAQAYKRIGLPAFDEKEGQRQASERLHYAGVPGIKYLDQFFAARLQKLHFNDIPARKAFPEAYEGKNSSGTWKTIMNYTPEELAHSHLMQKIPDEIEDPKELSKAISATVEELRNSSTRMKKMYDPKEATYWEGMTPGQDTHYQNAADWLEQNKSAYNSRTPPQTSNYVIFHPENLKIVGRNGQELAQVTGACR